MHSSKIDHTYNWRQGISQCRHRIFVKHFCHEDTDFYQNLTYVVIIFWIFLDIFDILRNQSLLYFLRSIVHLLQRFWKKESMSGSHLCKIIYSCEIFQSSNLDQPQRIINASLVNYFRVFETISVSCELFSSGWDSSQRRNWNSIRCQLRGITSLKPDANRSQPLSFSFQHNVHKKSKSWSDIPISK